MPRQPRILITGGLGFIFSHVTEHFVQKGWDVMVVDNLSKGSHPEIIDRSFWFINEDCSNPRVIDIIHDFDPDYVIHAAANSDVDNSIANPLFTFTNNAISTMMVFEACRGLKNLKKLIYVSTDEVYGECEERKKEDDIIFPRNPYSLSKAVGSLMRLAYDNTYPELKDKTAETRFCNVFGPRQDDRKIMPAIKRALEGGEPVSVHNGGIAYREWIYVKEIPHVIELILEKGNRTYNVTGGWHATVKELIDMARIIKGKNVPTTEGIRAGMDVKYQMDASRLIELGWKPKYQFMEALVAYLHNKPL